MVNGLVVNVVMLVINVVNAITCLEGCSKCGTAAVCTGTFLDTVIRDLEEIRGLHQCAESKLGRIS